MRVVCSFLLIVCGTMVALGQALVDDKTKLVLDSLSSAYSEFFASNSKSARAFREAGNLYPNVNSQIAGVTEAGDILFYQTHNEDAAMATQASSLHRGGVSALNLHGKGVIIGVWDGNTPLSTHQEFGGRVILRENDGFTSSHATHVNGTILAAGVNESARGMAPEANSYSYNFSNAESEIAAEASEGLILSNHSWGYIRGWDDGVWFGNENISDKEDYLFGFYGSTARTWDEIAYNSPYHLMVKSAGNERGDNGSGFPPDCDEGSGFDCIGSAGVSKNVLTVGAVRKNGNDLGDPGSVLMSSFSSWGPLDDGRIKPDVVGIGVSVLSSVGTSDQSYGSLQGTSMSTPNVSGSLVLVQEFSQKYFGSFLLSTTVKGLTIHTAREAGDFPGPDYRFGWGLVQVGDAIELLRKKELDNFMVLEDTLLNDESMEFFFDSDGSSPLKATLVWLDPPGDPVAASLDPTDVMLKNDLDLRIFDDQGVEFFPWKLDQANPEVGATQADNIVDNVEQVWIEFPTAGTYRVVMSHKGTLTDDQQQFSLIVNSEGYLNANTDFYFWTGMENNDWDNLNNWEDGEGEAVLELPSSDDIVLINDDSQEILLDQDMSVRSLVIESSGFDRVLKSNNGSSLTIQESMVIDGSLIVDGLSEIRFSGSDVISSLDFGDNYLATDLVLDGSASRWKLENFSGVKGLELLNGNLESDDEQLHLGSLVIGENYLYDQELDGKTLMIDSAAVIHSAVDFSNVSLDLSSSQVAEKLIHSESGVLGSLSVSGGSVDFKGDFEVLSTSFTDVSEWIIEEGAMVTIGAFSSESTGTLTVRSSVENSKASILSNMERRICLSGLMIEDIDVSGSTEFVIGQGSLLDNALGWILQDCDDHLFPDFIASSLCADQFASFEDFSTGNPVTWAWAVSPGGFTSTDQNVEVLFDEPGEYQVELTIGDGSTFKSYSRNVQIDESPLSMPSIVEQNNFLIAGLTAESYEWYLNDVLISTHNFIEFSGNGSYRLVVFDGDCSFASEELLIVQDVTSTSQVAIFPNPVDDYLNVESPLNESVHYRILDLSGRELTRGKTGTGRIWVGEIERGLYFLAIGSDNVKFFKK